MGNQQNKYVLSALVFSNFAQFGARVVLSPFVLVIAADFGTSKTQIGLVLTLLWAVFACLQFPSGVLADRFGERKIILVALLLTTAGSALVAVAPSFAVFVLAVLVLGAGTGLYFSVGSAMLARLYHNIGQVLGIHSAGAPLAGLVFPVAGTVVASRYMWRAGVALGALVGAIAFVVVLWHVTALPAVSPDSRIRDRLSVTTIRTVLGRPSVLFTTIIASIGMFAFQSFVSFFPAFLSEHHELSEQTAGVAFGILFVLIFLGLPVSGRIGDRVDIDAGIALPMGVAVVGLVVVLSVSKTLFLFGGVAILGLGITWSSSTQARFMQHFGENQRGTNFGLVRTVFVLFGSLGNAVTGFLADVANWTVAYGVVMGILVLGIALLVLNRLFNRGL